MSGGYGNHPNEAEGRPNGSAPDGMPSRDRSTSRPDQSLDDAAALVLGALPEDERSQAMGRLRRDPAFRREVAELTPVVGLLPSILVLPDVDRLPSTAGPVGSDLAPSRDLRARILAEVAAEARPQPVQRNRSAQAPLAQQRRPVDAFPGIAPERLSPPTLPGSRAPSRTAPPPIGRSRFEIGRGVNTWLTAVMAAMILVFAVAAIALVVRNATLNDRVDSLREQVGQLDAESAALQNEVALANSQSNASAWVLNPSDANPIAQNASGTVFYSYREGSVAAEIRGLAAPVDGQVYQLWYLGVDGSEQPRSAGVMTYSSDGVAFFTAADVPNDFKQFAVSVEPAGGSEQPTTVVLVGTLSAAG